jgi:hypothetical protein
MSWYRRLPAIVVELGDQVEDGELEADRWR